MERYRDGIKPRQVRGIGMEIRLKVQRNVITSKIVERLVRVRPHTRLQDFLEMVQRSLSNSGTGSTAFGALKIIRFKPQHFNRLTVFQGS